MDDGKAYLNPEGRRMAMDGARDLCSFIFSEQMLLYTVGGVQQEQLCNVLIDGHATRPEIWLVRFT